MQTDWSTLEVHPRNYTGSRLHYEQFCSLNQSQKDKGLITELEFYKRQALLDMEFTDWIQSN